MKYFSEILNKNFNSEKECLAAEKEYTLAQMKANEEKEIKEKARKARAKEVEEAGQRYVDLLNAFIKDYGSFHTSIRDGSDFFGSLINLLFD